MTKQPTKAQYVEAYGQERQTNILLEERLAELELSMEDSAYIKLSMEGDREFSRNGIDKIVKLSRIMQLKNPLINHAVDVMSHYVFGQGAELAYEDERPNDVRQGAWAGAKDRARRPGPPGAAPGNRPRK